MLTYLAVSFGLGIVAFVASVIWKAAKRREELDKEITNRWKLPEELEPVERYYHNAVVRQDAAHPVSGPHIIHMPPKANEELTHPTELPEAIPVAEVIPEVIPLPDLTREHLIKLRCPPAASNKPETDNFLRFEKDGVYKIRILPGSNVVQDQRWFMARKQHYITPGKPAVQCLKRHDGNKWVGDCPICAYWTHLWKMADSTRDYRRAEELKNQARQVKGMERYYYNVLLKDKETGEISGPKIWSVGVLLHNQLNQILNGVPEESDNFLDIDKGYWLKVRREIKGGCWPTYDVMVVGDQCPPGTAEQVEHWMANLWDLQSVSGHWHKSRDELVAALKDHLGVASPVVRKEKLCKVCSTPFHTEFEKQTVCCGVCAVNSGLPLGCPVCGEKDLCHNQQGAWCYKCGYASGYGFTFRCKEAPNCSCTPETLDRYPRGCKCGSVRCRKAESQPMTLADHEFLEELRKVS